MIFSFIERARQRYVWNELWAQSAWAVSLLLGCVILLLLAGTQLLDWRIVLALAVLGLGFGLYRILSRIPSPYRIAVLVDARAGLNDALSTALHFEQHPPSGAALPAIREFQKTQAERLIPSVNLQTAVPFRTPRAMYIVALLGILASGLFALRYGIRRTMDLRTPLPQVVMDGFGLHAPEDKLAADARKKNGDPKTAETFDENGNPMARSDQKRAGELDAAPASALESVSDPDVNNEKAQSASAGKDGNSKGEAGEKEGDQKGASEQAENGQPAAGKNAADNPSGSKEGQQQGEQSASKQGGEPQSSSMMSKLKDAMQNLMSKVSPQNGQAGQKPNGQQGQQKGQSQQAKAGEKGTPGESKDGGQQESAEGQQGQQAGDQDNSDQGQGKGNGKSSEQQAAAQPGSGVGKQDGSKDVKAAEQKAAMGKLSEVIGKRSASVSGEMMVESQSGPQQLRTQYSKRSATHGEAAGEVNRDEVPVELQGYVQQYFEEVRKSERAAGAHKAEPKVK